MDDARDLWPPNDRLVPPGDELARLVHELRHVLDTVAGAAAPDDAMAQAADALAAVRTALAPFQAEESRQLVGRRMDLTGRGSPLVPVLLVDEATEGSVRGRVTFTRHFMGGGMAAHGGSISTVFDSVLGRLANIGSTPTRTAFLHVDYRSVARIGHELTFTARVDSAEGRKRFISGELLDGEVLVAQCHGLFVRLLPGQP